MALNKKSDKWKQAPAWVKLGMVGLKSRKSTLLFEYFCLALGFVGFVGKSFDPLLVPFMCFWLAAYLYAVTIRWVDNSNLWDSQE